MSGKPSTTPEQGIASAMIDIEAINGAQDYNERAEISGISVLDGDHPIFDIEAFRKRHPCSLKLFGAYSIWNHSKYGEFRINWFCNHRAEKLAPYEDLICVYERGDWYDAKDCVDESFSAEEIELLREYLQSGDGKELHTYEIELPIMKSLMPFGAIGSFSIYDVCGDNVTRHVTIEDYYLLSKEEGYSLPFEVQGYYCIEKIWQDYPDI